MPLENASSESNEDLERIVGLLTAHRLKLFSYIYTLVPDVNDAEDILQETSMVICRKYQEFQPKTDFVAWAYRIAWWQVRYAIQKKARSRVFADESVLEAVATTAAGVSEDLDNRYEALQTCLQRLSDRDRRTILTRYERGGGVEQAARESGRSVPATYKALFRIRAVLLDCINSRLMVAGKGN
jgi:RNA polymerase sigma-70 factor (ECF subfamily)